MNAHPRDAFLRSWTAGAVALVALQAHAGSISATVTSQSNVLVPQAVVFARPTGGAMPKSAPQPAIMDQINKEFVPFVVPVQVGAAVTFPNRDNIRHHVYSFSPAKPFELKLYSGVPAKPVTFDKPGPVALGCNIHDWMVGYVYVMDTPWFGKTDKSGHVDIADLPPGEYEVRVWHPWMQGEPVAQKIKLDAQSARLPLRVTLNPPPANSSAQ